VRPILAAALALGCLALAGCGSSGEAKRASATPDPKPLLPDRFVRQPGVKTDMDTNPANLASAVVTYSFGQLPMYIDGAAFRLLPHDMEQTSEPGTTLTKVYRLTVPQTRLVLDTAVTAAPLVSEAKELARAYTIGVSLDRRYLRDPNRFWVFYRNNGPQICRIYFPGDLGSLNMGANSMVLQPLPAGRHVIRVELRHRISDSQAPARRIAVYHLRVLPRLPNAAEQALAPDEEGPPPENNRTPLTFRTDHPELLTAGR
jgi:hypothetical protein